MPMISWAGRHTDHVQLAVTTYEFPDIADGYDANWVRVRITAQNELGRWTRSCACLLTWELRWVAQWFTKVSQGLVDDRLVLLEPDLQFQYLATSAGSHRFAIRLAYGLGYPSLTSETRTSVIIVSLSETELQHAVAFFNDAAVRLPARGQHGRLMHRDLPEIDGP